MEIFELSEQNPWWKDKKLIERDYDIEKWEAKTYKWVPDFVDKIGLFPFSLHVVLGPRQVGKTTALKLLIKKLLNKKDPKSLFYFNCENIGDKKELSDLIKTYLDFKDSNDIKNSVIILDEITSPKEWFKGIKVLIDTGKLTNDVLILTGSTSIAVKREIELFPGRRGRGKDFLILPLSFRNFLKVVYPNLYSKIDKITRLDEIEKIATKNIIYLKELNNALENYMKHGGFPLGIEAIGRGREDAKRTYLAWIKTSILKAERNDLIAKQILRSVLEKIPSPISWESVSKGIDIKSPKTVSAYIDLLKSIFVLDVLYSIDINTKRLKFGKNKKIHTTDPLLLEILEEWCLMKVKNRESIIAESLVASHLNRIFPERTAFWRNGFEIDVVVLEKNNLYGFEVKWSEKPADCKSLPQLKRGFILTKKEFSKSPVKIPLSVFLAMI